MGDILIIQKEVVGGVGGVGWVGGTNRLYFLEWLVPKGYMITKMIRGPQ